jgi:PBP1b-binding outer membrane lipoprotein LpoB
MGEIPHSDKMFHLPIEVSVYVPSTQDVDKVVSKSEMKLRVEEVKKYLATLFGGFSSSSVEGGFLASDGKVVKENVERVVSFAEKSDFDKNKEALVQKASEWAAKWGQEAIGLEHEGDLYYVPQKFENGGTIAIREAKEMANSQAIELKHHASELANVLKKNPTIEAWVIAKLERASSDLSDVTHYLEGRTQSSGSKMKNGGKLSEKMIKVKVVYLEQQYFELTKEMEIPLSVYKEYDKTGKVPLEITHDLISETTLEHHVETNPISVRLTPVTSNKMKSGGNMEFERPTYQSNYVASQSQANEIADENWNMDYENDPLIKAQKKAKETATRIGMAVATRGMSEATPKTDGSSSMDMSPLMKGVK